jgi:hypothetical protein
MASLGSKVDSGPSQALSEALEVVQLMQQRLQKTNARLLKVEEATKSITNTHKKIDAKLDGLYKLLQQCNSPSEFSNMEKPHHPFPIQQIHHTLLTADELAYLKKQEVVKILLHRDPPPSSMHTVTHDTYASASLSFHIPDQHNTANSGFVYAQPYPDTPPIQTPPQTHLNRTKPNMYTNNQHTIQQP